MMIQSIGQVMLYVSDVDASADFWKNKMGFEQVELQLQGGYKSYVISPLKESDV